MNWKLGTTLLFLLAVSTTGSVSAAGAGTTGIDLWSGEFRFHGNNATGLDWLNPGGSVLNIGGQLDLQGNRLTGLADPTNAQDAATRSWVNTNDDYEADTTVNGCSNCLDIGTEVSDPGGLADGDDDTNADTECVGSNYYLAGDGTCQQDQDSQSISSVLSVNNDVGGFRIIGGNNGDNYVDLDATGGHTTIKAGAGTGARLQLYADGAVELFPDLDSSTSHCIVTSGGDLTCDGTKSWVHSLNSTHEAVYTSQEGSRVRAVYEGNASVVNGQVNVSFPGHFVKTVSDESPSLRVQVTPHELATVAVTERSDSWIVIEASTDVDVDYRVTGVREGYEDKQVVRRKEAE